jgi:hypothetical protein
MNKCKNNKKDNKKVIIKTVRLTMTKRLEENIGKIL